jgi:hypothetical protein
MQFIILDISYAIGVLNRFISKPGNEYWHVMKRVINYYVLGIEKYDIFLYI